MTWESIRVVQWTTGNVGRRSVRAIATNDDLALTAPRGFVRRFVVAPSTPGHADIDRDCRGRDESRLI